MAPARAVQAAIIDLLEHYGPLDDDQLGAALGMSRQSAQSAALRMSDAGLVARAKPAAVSGSQASPPALDLRPLMRIRSGLGHAIPDETAAVTALPAIYAFTGGKAPRTRIAALEQALVGADVDMVSGLLWREMVSDSTLSAGLLVKSLAGGQRSDSRARDPVEPAAHPHARRAGTECIPRRRHRRQAA